jgi:DNA-binding CsgD family transcriptional regulator
MKSSFKPAWDYLSRAQSCGTLDDMQDLFAGALQPFEFDRFSCAIMAGARRSRTRQRVLFGRSYAKWDEHYLAQGYLKKDPCVKKLFTTDKAFAWNDTPLEDLSPIGRQIRVEASAAGASNGIVVPVPGDDDELYCVRFSSPAETFDQEAWLTLSTLAMSYCVVGNKMVAQAKKRPGDSPLSMREAECLAWVSEGKSDWDISEILKISQWTVHEHIERAKTKLGVRSRVQAVMKSATNGWLPNNPS